MSVGAMSALMQKRVISALQRSIQRGNPTLTSRIVENHILRTSTGALRVKTNGNTENVFTRGGLAELKSEMEAYLTKHKVYNAILIDVLGNLKYDDFVAYVIGTPEYTKVADNNFIYTETVDNATAFKSLESKSKDSLILKNVPLNTLLKLFKEYILEQVPPEHHKEAKTILKKMLNSGHLVGVFTGRFIKSLHLGLDEFGNIQNIAGIKNSTAQPIFQNILDLVSAADLLSSNVYNDVNIVSKALKNLSTTKLGINFSAEIQVSESNQDVGRMLSSAGKAVGSLLRSLTSPDPSDVNLQKLLNSLVQVRDYVQLRQLELSGQKRISPELRVELDKIVKSITLYDQLITTPGSDPISKHVEKAVASAIDGKKRTTNGVSSATAKKHIPVAKRKATPVPKITSPYIAFGVKSAKKKAVIEKSLYSLHYILNTVLSEYVKNNMGSGDRKDILNLRTGRFAESVEVKKLTQSREGMITAFYTYMKYPYETFSKGWAQQVPRSRDPKLLIAKSIRQVLLENSIDKIRAVLL